MFKRLFKKKKKVIIDDSKIHVDKITGEITFDGKRIRVVFPDHEWESILMDVNHRSIYLSSDDYMAMYVYFSMVYLTSEE